ncbi:Uncharacterised protein [uncultured archaeon]|nr:Uncharacterised protein [uncultured archaeon]
MDRMLGPTGAMLVGTVFLCFILVLGVSASDSQSHLFDPFSNIEEHNFDRMHKSDSEKGKLKLAGSTISFPWASLHFPSLDQSPAEVMPRLPPTRDEIIMKGSQSEERLQDLKAINAAMQRDIVYDQSQSGGPDSQGLVNSMGVRVTGNGQSSREWSGVDLGDNSLEEFVDNAINSGLKDNTVDGKVAEGYQGQKHLGNYMDIDVSGVSVSAINTQEGGSAVATSNIIIKPVQVIVCPSQATEKLK